MKPEDVILCWRPRKLKVGYVRKLLAQKDEIAKEYLADLILHRLRDRYVTPLENGPKWPVDFRSGFLMMAAASLMIGHRLDAASFPEMPAWQPDPGRSQRRCGRPR